MKPRKILVIGDPMPALSGRVALSQLSVPLDASLEVDTESGVIRNISVITAGVACGHNAPPFLIDETTLQNVADAINLTENGMKSRTIHAEVYGEDGLKSLAGKIRNARVVGNQVKADFHLGSYADEEDARRLMALAKDAPEDAGLSIVIKEGHYEAIEGEPGIVARIDALYAIDWTGNPAANPAGMLSAPAKAALAQKDEIPMEFNEAQMEYLRSLGLAADATAEQAAEFYAGLTDEQKTACDALAESETETEVEAAPAAAAAEGEDEDEGQPKPMTAASGVADASQVALSSNSGAMATLSEINEIARLAGLGGDWAVEMCLAGKTPAEARQIALAKKTSNTGPIPMSIKVGEDRGMVSLSAGITDAIILRANGVALKKAHDRSSEFRGLSVINMARNYYAALGMRNAHTLSNTRIVELMGPRAFRNAYPALAQSASSFSSILADAINKSLRAAYMDAPSTWQLWARRATAPDFKDIKRVALSDVPGLTERGDGQPLDYTVLSDGAETYALAEFAGGIKLTRRAIVNDDLDAFGRIPMAQAAAAKRKEDDVAYGIITTNGNMADGGALFNATAVSTTGGHANLVGSGTVMSIANLQILENLMFVQTGPKGAHLELVPKFLLVPSSKGATANQLINSAVDPTATYGHATNPYANTLTVIKSSRLQANSATAWYLAADYRDGQVDTIEVCFLEDEPEPVLKQETDFDTDDQKFAVRHTVQAKAIDWRGVAKNNGA
ncbi:hypothetical protein HED60_14965 [Planctomycetales bacterium ZRK34]|nr:hypothetical protein HED60_14965 [Planctomycetales bacterium ZRK34]